MASCNEKRLFDPPAEILHRILSFLSVKEAAKASLISKAYLQAWRKRPNLDLDWDSFRDKQMFVNFVNTTMLRYRGKENIIGIQSFRLKINFNFDDSVSIIDPWIETAIENGVSKMDLSIITGTGDLVYKFPQRFFEAKSLTDLCVFGGKLEKQDVEKSLMWHNLRRLSLRCLTVRDEMLQSIISCCKLLEYLKIDCCWGLTGIKVNDHKNLKQLYIGCSFPDQKVEVGTAGLETFACKMYGLPKNCVFNLSEYKNLKQLKFYNVRITDEEFFQCLASKFPCIEDLEMQNCECVAPPRRFPRSPSLKKIMIWRS